MASSENLPVTRHSESGQVVQSEGRIPAPISLFYPLSVISRNGLTVLIAAVVTAVLLAALSLIQPKSYTATASFIPQGAGRGLQGAASIAAQFGLIAYSSGGERSPQFYASIVSSPGFRRILAADTYDSEEHGTAPLVELLSAKGDTDADRLDWVARRLERMVQATVARESGIVRLTVSHPDPVLARELAARALQLVNDFNLDRQQASARHERAFVQERLEEQRREMLEAENRLKAFLQQNRQFRNSPEMQFEYDRLQRDVALRQQVLISMISALDEARIAEARNTPIITVIDTPVVPTRPDGRGTIRLGLLGLFVGGTIGIGLAFLREQGRIARDRRDPSYIELVATMTRWRAAR